MGYIHCCGALRKSKTFMLKPEGKYLICEVDLLECCPVCNHKVVQLTRIDIDNKVSTYRKVNKKAVDFLEKIKKELICENKDYKNVIIGSKFYLNYNEYGKKKKCYSNLSTLKIGLFENKYYQHTTPHIN